MFLCTTVKTPLYRKSPHLLLLLCIGCHQLSTIYSPRSLSCRHLLLPLVLLPMMLPMMLPLQALYALLLLSLLPLLLLMVTISAQKMQLS